MSQQEPPHDDDEQEREMVCTQCGARYSSPEELNTVEAEIRRIDTKHVCTECDGASFAWIP